MDSFTQYFNEFITKRTEDLWQKGKHGNKDLNKIEIMLTEIQEGMLKKLENEEKEMFLKYDELMNLELAFLRQVVYKLGLSDGIKIAGGTNDLLLGEFLD